MVIKLKKGLLLLEVRRRMPREFSIGKKKLQVNVLLFKFRGWVWSDGLRLTGWNLLHFTFIANGDTRWPVWQFSILQKQRFSEWKRNSWSYYIIFSHWVFFALRCCVLAIWLPLTSFGSVIEANKIDCWKDQYYLVHYWMLKTFILYFLTFLISFVGKKKWWKLLHVNLSVFIYCEQSFQNFTVCEPESLFQKWSHIKTRLPKFWISQIQKNI